MHYGGNNKDKWIEYSPKWYREAYKKFAEENPSKKDDKVLGKLREMDLRNAKKKKRRKEKMEKKKKNNEK